MTLQIGNINEQNPSHFFQTIQDNTSETALPVVDEYVSLVGTRVEVILANFEVVGTALKYIGTTPINIAFNGAVTWEAGGTLNSRYKIALFKNDVSLGKVEGTLDNSNSWPRNVSFNGIVNLTENDLIDVRVANENNTQGISVIDLLFSGESI